MKTLRLFVPVFYVVCSIFGLRLAVDLVVSIFRGDGSPWWLWLTGLGATFLLLILAGKLVSFRPRRG